MTKTQIEKEASRTVTYRIEEHASRYHVFLGDRRIAECKSREAAERVIADRERHLAASEASREAHAAASRERDARTQALIAALRPRLRKTVSRDPGFSVNALGSRCVAVPTYWGNAPRTCIVVMAPGASMHGTRPLDDADLLQFEIDLDDDETREIAEKHAGI